jgi:hypothetical protein
MSIVERVFYIRKTQVWLGICSKEQLPQAQEAGGKSHACGCRKIAPLEVCYGYFPSIRTPVENIRVPHGVPAVHVATISLVREDNDTRFSLPPTVRTRNEFVSVIIA